MSFKKYLAENNDNPYHNFDFTYVGERIKSIRKEHGESRQMMAEIVGLKVTQYGLLEAKSSSSLRNFIAILNYFRIRYNVNPNWIILKDNSSIPKYISHNRDWAVMVGELNEELKSQRLMVSLVPYK